MRAFMLKGLVFVALVLFSVQVLADVADCDEQLKPHKELKPLYGLCVAYWSSGADEELPLLDLYRAKAAKLAEKFPDLDVPTDPPGFVNADSCPCWDIAALRELLACERWELDGGGYIPGFATYIAAFIHPDLPGYPQFLVGPYDETEPVNCFSYGAEDLVLDNWVIVEGSKEQACRDDVIGLYTNPPVYSVACGE